MCVHFWDCPPPSEVAGCYVVATCRKCGATKTMRTIFEKPDGNGVRWIPAKKYDPTMVYNKKTKSRKMLY